MAICYICDAFLLVNNTKQNKVHMHTSLFNSSNRIVKSGGCLDAVVSKRSCRSTPQK